MQSWQQPSDFWDVSYSNYKIYLLAIWINQMAWLGLISLIASAQHQRYAWLQFGLANAKNLVLFKSAQPYSQGKQTQRLLRRSITNSYIDYVMVRKHGKKSANLEREKGVACPCTSCCKKWTYKVLAGNVWCVDQKTNTKIHIWNITGC